MSRRVYPDDARFAGCHTGLRASLAERIECQPLVPGRWWSQWLLPYGLCLASAAGQQCAT
jgi:hypothetical protein